MTQYQYKRRTIWAQESYLPVVTIVDQRFLPHQFVLADLNSVEDTALAIRDMWVRGAPLIGVTAAYGMYFAAREAAQSDDFEASLQSAADILLATRPTAVNLKWAIEQQKKVLKLPGTAEEKIQRALQSAHLMAEEDAEVCRQIGLHGLSLIQEISKSKAGKPVQILTHCNAGRMACVEWGTATSPIYQAHQAGIAVHVWVDETRPRNQGASITAWELAEAGIPHTVIPDNAGGHLMQHRMVDICFVGTDRTALNGDVANKIGTYLKALAAKDNNIPFYVALPSSTIDWEIKKGVEEIPIEKRSAREVTHIQGWDEINEKITEIRLTPADSPAVNYAFDVTPAHYISGLITEKGICPASETGIRSLFPEKIPY
ncbi:MAG: S-methyl-5-thioribose-1-phosphate isomerase [Bacteroidia bacterium]|nr:S-methyl-5-thioribose-1-phosphate isomerase [Bacteroidia bacterium]